MMRDRGYYRDQRERHIRRKERIIKEQNNYWHYKFRGSLSKSKIHCSCGMCSRYEKTNNKAGRRFIHGNYAPSYNPSWRDRKRNDEMDSQEEEESLQE